MFHNPQTTFNYLIGLLIKFARPINFGFEFITHIDFLFYDINHTTSHPFFAIATKKSTCVDLIINIAWCDDFIFWSGWWESNPRSQLGRLRFYHWTTSAFQVGNTNYTLFFLFVNTHILYFWLIFKYIFGGPSRIWTNDQGVAVPCLTTWL